MSNWNEPPTETITLLSGETVQANINGIWANGSRGMAFVCGQEISVEKFDGSWYEYRERRKVDTVGQHFSA